MYSPVMGTKLAKNLRVGDCILVGGEKLTALHTETSDIGKQGAVKCRIEAQKQNGERVLIIRPAEYPFMTP